MISLLLSSAFAAPAPTIEWAQDITGERARFAIVGSLPDDDGALAAAVRAVEPDVTVFTTLSPKRDVSGWKGPFMAFPLGAKASGRWLTRLEGVGISGMKKPVPYGWVDVTAGKTRWRMLYVSTAPTPAGRWEEQAYWLPGALDDGDFDRLVVFADGPRHSLSDADVQPRGGRVLLDRIQDSTDPMSFVGWIGGNTFTNEVFTPGGRFGELHLCAGDSGGESATFARSGTGMPGVIRRETLEPAYDNVVQELAEGDERYSIEGFWLLEVEGSKALLDFHHDRGNGFEVVYRMVRDGTGWHVP